MNVGAFVIMTNTLRIRQNAITQRIGEAFRKMWGSVLLGTQNGVFEVCRGRRCASLVQKVYIIMFT